MVIAVDLQSARNLGNFLTRVIAVDLISNDTFLSLRKRERERERERETLSFSNPLSLSLPFVFSSFQTFPSTSVARDLRRDLMQMLPFFDSQPCGSVFGFLIFATGSLNKTLVRLLFLLQCYSVKKPLHVITIESSSFCFLTVVSLGFFFSSLSSVSAD
jgi:hypothetical protein